MTQLSRPYQVALLGIGLFAAVWFIALRGHSSSGSSSGSSVPAPQTSTPAPKPASTPYHGSAPGVAGLTRDIEKAHNAVVQSEQNAKQLQQKSAQASTSSPTSSSPSAPAAQGAPQAKQGATEQTPSTSAAPAGAKTSTAQAPGAPAHHSASPSPASKLGAASAMQPAVESELAHGKVVLILLWDPHSSVDQSVQNELQAVGRALGGKVVVHAALPSQIGSFGSFTRAVQVYQTPTVLIVNKRGRATSLVGLTDAYSVEQAIGEASH